MEALKWEYDIIASEAVHRLRSVCGNQGDLYHQLEHFHTSDPVLEKFWQITRIIPPWVDWEQLGRGQAVCKRYAIPMLIGFAFQGFAGEIAAAIGPAEVLVRTGGLAQRNIVGRVASTLRWLMEVTESPESLHADGPGFVSTIRVRLRHAAVRQRLLAIPNSHPAFLDTTLHGIPINTFDSILTLTFFCCNPIWIQLPQLGIILNENEAEDLVALFRYLAYLLGVPTEYFASAAMARKTMKTIKDGKAPPSESSKKITQDFIAAFAEKAPYNISRGFLQAGIRAMNPGPVCDALGVEAVGWSSYIVFASLRWSVRIATVGRSIGLPLPPDNILIEVCKLVRRNNGTNIVALKLTLQKDCCRYLPPLQLYSPQKFENHTTCGLGYESAFLSLCPASRDNNALVRGRKRIKSIFCIRRPVETGLLSLVVVSLLLGFALNTIIVKSMIRVSR